MTLEAIVAEIRSLPIEERKQLITVIVDSLTENAPILHKHSLRELRGLGKSIWQGVDTQAYVNQERDEWDIPR